MGLYHVSHVGMIFIQSTDVVMIGGSRCSTRLSPQTLCQTDTILPHVAPIGKHSGALDEKTIKKKKNSILTKINTTLDIAVNKHAS